MADDEIIEINDMNSIPRKSFFSREDIDDSDTIDLNELFGDLGLKNIEPSDEKKVIYSLETLAKHETSSYIRFDKEFRKFLKHYVRQQKKKEFQKLVLKGFFFGIIMLGFVILLATPMVIMLFCAEKSSSVLITSLIASLIELVSAIIVLPKIIAEYLFNKEEDKNMMEIIKYMQRYNEKKHHYIENHGKSNF